MINLLPSKKIRQALRKKILEDTVWGATVTDIVPAVSSPPADLLPKYTMNGKIALRYSYFNDTVSTPLIVSRKQYERTFSDFAARRFVYYQNSMDCFHDAFDKYPVTGKTVLVYGLAATNCEAFAVWRGAERVIVVDYNAPVCEHEKITVMTHKEILEKNVKADVAISFSSFEHDGLGRYGDPLIPDGDLQAMRFAWEHLVDNGLLFLGVPLGKDCVVWNAHRVYGRHRLPLLLRGWDVLGVYGEFTMPEGGQSVFDVSLYESGYLQPLMVLRRAEEDSTAGTEFLKPVGEKKAKTNNSVLLSDVLSVKAAGVTSGNCKRGNL